MHKPPSDNPPKDDVKEPVTPSVPDPHRAKPAFYPFGLSAKQFAKVTRNMLKVARSVTRHSGASPEDAVQQAFVKALSKPSIEQPSIQDQTKFSAWMVKLTKYEALTNRTAQRRRAQREMDAGTDLAEMISIPASVGAVEARKMLYRAFCALKPQEQALLHALHAEGKTINDIVCEKKLAWSTVNSRHERLLKLLYAAIQATIAAIVFLPGKAHAFVAHVKKKLPHLLVQAPQLGGAMMITVICGIVSPTGSSAMTAMSPSTNPVGLTPYSSPQTTIAEAARLPHSSTPEVEPEEPKALDAETNQCSLADMKSTQIHRFLPETIVSLALVAAPALTQTACTGTAQQTPPAQQPADERDDSADPYDVVCDQERARGNKCPDRDEWYHRFDPR